MAGSAATSMPAPVYPIITIAYVSISLLGFFTRGACKTLKRMTYPPIPAILIAYCCDDVAKNHDEHIRDHS